MHLFGRKPPLEDGKTLTPVEYLCKLQEETNSLLRELLRATGNHAKTPKTESSEPKKKYDSTVTVVNRSMRIQQQVERETQIAAPWRTPGSGQVSAMTFPKDGSKLDASKVDAFLGVSPPDPHGP